MATFYILPPRACLEDALGDVLSRFLPGVPLPADIWDVVAECLSGGAGWPRDLFLVTRDDLPAGVPTAASLAESFGAEPGDRVVEVGAATGPRAWVLPADVSAAAAAR